jgi:hypothetical protein
VIGVGFIHVFDTEVIDDEADSDVAPVAAQQTPHTSHDGRDGEEAFSAKVVQLVASHIWSPES